MASGPDLFVRIEDVCAIECEQGNVTVWYTLGNQGFNDVTDPISVSIDLIGICDRATIVSVIGDAIVISIRRAGSSTCATTAAAGIVVCRMLMKRQLRQATPKAT